MHSGQITGSPVRGLRGVAPRRTGMIEGAEAEAEAELKLSLEFERALDGDDVLVVALGSDGDETAAVAATPVVIGALESHEDFFILSEQKRF